jgi:hypothetical protein
MTVTQITNASNIFTDEQISPQLAIYFRNECLSKINIELRSTLPLIEYVHSASYTALSESWQNVLFVPYVCYSIKMNDGSLNEADRYLSKFNENLVKLIQDKNHAIDSAYRDTDFTAIYRTDPTMGINTGWFTRKRDGGF